MNLANLINDGKLKKTFIVATLVSTLVGTLTASMTLSDKVEERRRNKRQQQLDGKQDGQIKKLEEQVNRLQPKRDRSSSRSSSNGKRSRRRRGDSDDEEDYDDYRRSATRSKALIEQQFEDNMRLMGRRGANEDLLTENRLQAQVIHMQQAIINVLQDALLNDRALTKADIHKLITAQDAARDGSLAALRDQCERGYPQLLNDAPTERRMIMAEEEMIVPLRKQNTMPVRQRALSVAAPRRRLTLPNILPHGLCQYSDELQRSRSRLVEAFEPRGTHVCHACDSYLDVSTTDSWVLDVRTIEDVSDDDHDGNRQVVMVQSYDVGGRFVVKCHTADGEFACVLCQRFRDVVSVCGNVKSLIRHLSEKHTSDHFDMEVDIERI